MTVTFRNLYCNIVHIASVEFREVAAVPVVSLSAFDQLVDKVSPDTTVVAAPKEYDLPLNRIASDGGNGIGDGTRPVGVTNEVPLPF
jgi:hypothetical protein